MIKNIFSEFGFSCLKNTLYAPQAIEEVKEIISNLPVRLPSVRQVIVTGNVFEEAYAISTAEDSELSARDARHVSLSPEIAARLAKYREDKTLTDKQKYDRLEFENVESAEAAIGSIGFKDLTVDFILRLHADLTVGLDPYCKSVGITPYCPGRLRQSDQIKIGKIRAYLPPAHQKIPSLLRLLFREYARRKTIHLADILEFHVLFYAIHPFQNGNKRVVRVLESMLLNHYGYGADRMLSLAVYYGTCKNEAHFFLMESLRRRDPVYFANFALRGYLSAAHELLLKIERQIFRAFSAYYESFLASSLRPSQRPKYQTALKSILDLKGRFTHGDFVRHMKKQGYPLGVSQMVLRALEEQKILNHQKRDYFIPDLARIIGGILEMEKVFLQHQISVAV